MRTKFSKNTPDSAAPLFIELRGRVRGLMVVLMTGRRDGITRERMRKPLVFADGSLSICPLFKGWR